MVVPEASLVPADSLVACRLRRDSGVRADLTVWSRREFEAERKVPNTLAFEAASPGSRRMSAERVIANTPRPSNPLESSSVDSLPAPRLFALVESSL